MIFQEKCFSGYMLLTDQIPLSDYLEILGNMCIAIVCFPDCDVISFEINVIFLIKPFLTWPKRQDKNVNILATKRAFKVK